MEFRSINDCLEKIRQWQNKKKIYIVGAGRYGMVLGKYLDKYNIVWDGFIDRCPELIDSNTKAIVSYEDIQKIDDIFIISSINFKQEMKECLKKKGVLDESIITFSDTDYIWEVFSQNYGEYRKYTNRINRFRNIHSGKRCFLIGNGPSLQVDDLNKLKNEYTFALNSIYYVYQHTAWRPTYYVTVSNDLFLTELSDKASFVKVIEGCEAAFTTMFVKAFEYRDDKDMDKLYYFRVCNFEKESKIRFSEDCSDYVYCRTNVLYVALQLAVYMGFSDIYLIGVDCSFSIELDESGGISFNNVSDYNKIIQQSRDNNKFSDMINKKYGNVHNSYATIEEYKVAKGYADAHNIHIYNATHGGKLEVFERVDFDDLMMKNGRLYQ